MNCFVCRRGRTPRVLIELPVLFVEEKTQRVLMNCFVCRREEGHQGS